VPNEVKEDRSKFQVIEFIEDMGIQFEEIGLPRMAGRIFGWLLVCDPPHQGTEELASVVGASKGSISSMTRLLIQSGVVERLGLPGKRGIYYRVKPGSWSELMRVRMAHMTAIRKLADRGLDLVAGKDPKISQRLRELRNLYAFLEKEIPALLDRYDRERKITKEPDAG
jgi:DNA-binding transcriptional regulator GbsR (MarR family)